MYRRPATHVNYAVSFFLALGTLLARLFAVSVWEATLMVLLVTGG